MKKLIIVFTICQFSFGLHAQEFEVPSYNFKTADDYAPLEQDVIGAFDWLMKTPLNEKQGKRKEVNAFLLAWVSGSPTVHIEIKQEIVTFMESSPDLLMIFIGGWTKYSLESKDYNNKVIGSQNGIEAVMEFYSKNKTALGKDKNIEKYLKMKEKGTLSKYIKSNS